jgi:hypothetical protein
MEITPLFYEQFKREPHPKPAEHITYFTRNKSCGAIADIMRGW